jgi:hypothetical protein
MADVFDCDKYHTARRYAGELAARLGCDVAIRKGREYGHPVIYVGLACAQDSDYAKAEIVRPGEPAWTGRD